MHVDRCTSAVQKWLTLISLYTTSFSQCALEATASQIEPIGHPASSSSSFFPSLTIPHTPISFRFQLFQSQRQVALEYLHIFSPELAHSLKKGGHVHHSTGDSHQT